MRRFELRDMTGPDRERWIRTHASACTTPDQIRLRIAEEEQFLEELGRRGLLGEFPVQDDARRELIRRLKEKLAGLLAEPHSRSEVGVELTAGAE